MKTLCCFLNSRLKSWSSWAHSLYVFNIENSRYLMKNLMSKFSNKLFLLDATEVTREMNLEMNWRNQVGPKRQ